MNNIYIHPNQNKISSDNQTKSCIIEVISGKRIILKEELFYTLPKNVDLPDEEDSESFTIAAIFTAMAYGGTVIVNGNISKELLSNLTEYVSIWNCWFPNLYKKIDFEILQIQNNTYRNNKSITAFSGGLDSTYTVWSHYKKLDGYRSRNISAGMMVLGFDIFKEDEFERAFHQANETLKSVGIPLFAIETNFRSVITQDWIHTHGTAISSCLSLFKKQYSIGLIPATRPYTYNNCILGSNPLTDPLLSSSALKIVHDGAKYYRDEKVLAISNWEKGVNNLRVCYSDKEKYKNCGKCRKCIQTRLCFEAQCVETPKVLNIQISGKDIRNVLITKKSHIWGAFRTLKIAKKNRTKLKYKWSVYFMIYKSLIYMYLRNNTLIRKFYIMHKKYK